MTAAPRARRAALAAAVAAVLLAGGREAAGRVYLTQQQALDLAFPAPRAIERRALYLSEEQARRAADRAGVPVEARVVPYYIGTLDGKVEGYAYFDTHLVRTLPETILILLGPDGRLRRIDILSFDEPEDYRPTERWLGQFPGRSFGDDLSLQRGIRSLTGATLSARAVTEAARRVLALHLLYVAPAPGGQPGPSPGHASPARP